MAMGSPSTLLQPSPKVSDRSLAAACAGSACTRTIRQQQLNWSCGLPFHAHCRHVYMYGCGSHCCCSCTVRGCTVATRDNNCCHLMHVNNGPTLSSHCCQLSLQTPATSLWWWCSRSTRASPSRMSCRSRQTLRAKIWMLSSCPPTTSLMQQVCAYHNACPPACLWVCGLAYHLHKREISCV